MVRDGDKRGDGDQPTPMEQTLRSCLGAWSSRAVVLAKRLVDAGVVVADLEASVRGGSSSEVTAGRMMLEGQSPSQARQLIDCLLEGLPDIADRWIGVAANEGVPLITGWDVAGASPAAKLYVNLSDASLSCRQRVAAELLGPGASQWPTPHVIGMNLFSDHHDCKLYTQHADLPDDASAPLTRWVDSAEQPVAGFVTSYGVSEGALFTRAHFVGLRSASLAFMEVAVSLPGWSTAAADIAPFAPGRVTSLGFATTGEQWTLYFKPRSHTGSMWGLDPTVCFTCDGGEIGVYLAAPAPGQRAYATTAGYAVSYRVREGKPAVADIEAVMAWVIQRVEAGELTREQPLTATLLPPEPWHVV